jgi:hypothetical protein
MAGNIIWETGRQCFPDSSMRTGKGAVWAVVVTALLLAATAFGGSRLYLEFRSYPDERVLYRIAVGKGDRFTTLIQHSVHLSPVYETYRIEGEGRIVLESTRLRDMGWGVPSTFDQAYSLRRGFMVIEGYDKELPFLPFRVSAINDAKLLLGDLPEDPARFAGRVFSLSEFATDGKRITFRIERSGGYRDWMHSLLS